MNSANLPRILEKTVHLELLAGDSCTRDISLTFPVSRNGIKYCHTWDFKWTSTREKLPQSQSCKHSTYNFELTGKQNNDFQYAKSYYQVKMTLKYYESHQILANETGVLTGNGYNRFHLSVGPFHFSKMGFKCVTLEMTFKSYEDQTPNAFKLMLDQGRLTDVVIKTKGKEFRCHKVVLATASEYFEKMFDVEMKEKMESVVNWTGVFEAKSVEDTLHFIYTGESPPHLKATCLELLEIGHMCFIPDLKALCVHHLQRTIDVKNMAEILRVAVKYDCVDLQESTVNFIVQNHDLEKGDDPWNKLEPLYLKSLAVTMLRAMVTKKISL